MENKKNPHSSLWGYKLGIYAYFEKSELWENDELTGFSEELKELFEKHFGKPHFVGMNRQPVANEPVDQIAS